MKWIKCARAADYGLIQHVGILDCSLAPQLLVIVQPRQLLLLPQLQVRVAAHPPQQLLCVLPLAQLDNQCIHQSGRQHHPQQGQQQRYHCYLWSHQIPFFPVIRTLHAMAARD